MHTVRRIFATCKGLAVWQVFFPVTEIIMKLIALDQRQLKKYTVDTEMLQKAHRPCALIIQLNYKGHRYDFAVPLRSNIHPSAPKDQYFALPNRGTTRDNYRHGVHYIKMFPVDRTKVHKFRTEGNLYYTLIKAVLDKHEKEIIRACQDYLIKYEQGKRPKYCTDIDLLINECLK